MSRKYRMTPKRKAALRKAQLASARKRRRGHNRRLAAAGGVTVLAVTAGAVYLGHRSRARRPTVGKELDVVRVTGLGSDVGTPLNPPSATAGFTRINVDVGRQTQLKIDAFQRAATRAAKKRESDRKKELRESRKRSTYWRSKPIPKRNRFTRAAQARRRKGKK